MNRKYLVFSIVFLSQLVFVSNSFGFKVDTHIWIGQQVINELAADSKVSFTLGRKEKVIDVPYTVAQAILEHPQQYLLGNIGPDAFPGIFEGQLSIHPYQAGSWGNNEWLEHVVSSARTPEELAFAYGFIGHAAADVFAHSYVNRFAGDVFSLLDDETDVESRHFLLESYISKHLPPFLNHEGNDLGAVQDVLRHKGGNIKIPHNFLRRIFLEDEVAVEQFASSGAGHIKLIAGLLAALENITRDGGLADQLHWEIQRQIISYYTGVQLDNASLEKLNELTQGVHDLASGAVDIAQEVHAEVNGILQRHNSQSLEQANKELDKVGDLLKSHRDLLEKEREVIDSIAETEDKLKSKLADLIAKGVCEFSCPRHPVPDPKWYDPGRIKFVEDPICKNKIKDCEEFGKLIKDAHFIELSDLLEAQNSLRQSLNERATKDLDNAKDIVQNAHDIAATLLRTELALSTNIIDLLQKYGGIDHANPIKGRYLEWKSDIKSAMDAYHLANLQTVLVTLDPGAEDGHKILADWAVCSAPSLAGIPSEIPKGFCAVRDGLEDISNYLGNIERALGDHNPVVIGVLDLKTDIEDSLKEFKSDAMLEAVDFLTGAELKKFIEISEANVNSTTLNNLFSTSPPSKNLLLIPDVSNRIDADMGRIGSNSLSLNSFNALFNAVELSKLSLLDADGLNQLLPGSRRTLFDNSSWKSGSIMGTLARDIDGNHHWLKDAIPHSRADETPIMPNETRYGAGEEWLMWENRSWRTKVFRKLFRGPLNPSLETPEKFGFLKVVPKAYDYRPSTKCAFPNYKKADPCPPPLPWRVWYWIVGK